MATRFPDPPPFTGFTAPMRVEADITSLEVAQGEVPEQLAGTYCAAPTGSPATS